jgi:hypothetical protein
MNLREDRPRLHATLTPFEWSLPESGDVRSSADLVRRYLLLLKSVGVEAVWGSREAGRLWTPLVDLSLGPLVTKPWIVWEPEAFFPARWLPRVAAGTDIPVLPRGTVMRFERHCMNPALLGWDSLIWSMAESRLDVHFVWSADDLNGGSNGVLANQVIVPIEHPLVGDDEVANRLVRDLQAIRLDPSRSVAS